MSKGSDRRPKQITREEFNQRWDLSFPKYAEASECSDVELAVATGMDREIYTIEKIDGQWRRRVNE